MNDDKQKRASALETEFVTSLCNLMQSRECRTDKPERCVAMIAALSCCVGSLIGAMDAYGTMIGASPADGERARSELVKLAASRITKSGNLASEIATSVWRATR